jgi:preprotein translocase subunit SecA
MRIFGSDRIAGVMDSLGLDDETPIENKLVSRSLESAQKKVEGHNFDTRKQLVEYDDVMNRHREVIYSRRRKALAAESLRDDVLEMVQTEVTAMVTAHVNSRTGEIDHDGLRQAVASIFPLTPELSEALGRAHESEMSGLVMDEARVLYERRAADFGPQITRMVERFTYINALDRLWIEHLEAMDSLRSGIGLRAIGQRDPLVEYKREGFRMFKQLLALLNADVATTIFKVSVHQQAAVEAPVETALTRAAEQARTNAPVDALSGGVSGGSRQERRAKERPALPTSQPAKKRKKRR